MAGQTYILCIETANTVTSVAISEDGACIGLKEVLETNKAADKLHLLIAELMIETKLSFKDLKAIAISSGPGSYTGLRIAAAAAKGYCFSLNIPLVAVPTFEAMVYGIKNRYNFFDADQYVPMIDARRMEIYLSFYTKEIRMAKAYSSLVLDENFGHLFDPEKKYVLFGNGAEKSERLLNSSRVQVVKDYVPSARDMCDLSFKRVLNNQFEDIAYFEPNYAKAFYTTRTN